MLLDESKYKPEPNRHFLGYLPNITGSLGTNAEYRNPGVFGSLTGAFYSRGSRYGRDSDGGGANREWGAVFDAHRCNDTYGKGGLNYNNVIPASISMLMCIKY